MDDERQVEGIGEGFPGQRMRVLPRPRVRSALTEPGTSALIVTDAGCFPHASRHGRRRESPIQQAIVLICARGRGRFASGGQTVELGPGTAVVIPKGNLHTYWADENDPWTIWWIHVEGFLVDDWFARVGETQPVVRLVDVFETTSLVDQALRHLERDTTPASILAASGAAWHLMTLLARARAPHDASADAIERAAEYLRNHFADKVSVSDLAAMCSLSASHFAALFKRQLGQPVHRFHIDLRMARARELLGATALPVAEVSRTVGFDDPFYFSRQFRRMHGQTPLSYRRQHAV